MSKQHPTPVFIQINANPNEINPWESPTVSYSLVDDGQHNVIYVRVDEYGKAKEGFGKALETIDASLDVINRLQTIVATQATMIELLKNGDNLV